MPPDSSGIRRTKCSSAEVMGASVAQDHSQFVFVFLASGLQSFFEGGVIKDGILCHLRFLILSSSLAGAVEENGLGAFLCCIPWPWAGTVQGLKLPCSVLEQELRKLEPHFEQKMPK